MGEEDTVSVQWAQEDVETSYSLLNINNNNNNNNVCICYLRLKCTTHGKLYVVEEAQLALLLRYWKSPFKEKPLL